VRTCPNTCFLDCSPICHNRLMVFHTRCILNHLESFLKYIYAWVSKWMPSWMEPGDHYLGNIPLKWLMWTQDWEPFGLHKGKIANQ
jgi:hypothetical protein